MKNTEQINRLIDEKGSLENAVCKLVEDFATKNSALMTKFDLSVGCDIVKHMDHEGNVLCSINAFSVQSKIQ